ncbi:MAG: hypothetical protein ACE5NA_12335 [Nitrospiraceae bacterium]
MGTGGAFDGTAHMNGGASRASLRRLWKVLGADDMSPRIPTVASLRLVKYTLILVFATYAVLCHALIAGAAEEDFDVDTVVTIIKNEIQDARAMQSSLHLDIDRVELDLTAIAEREATGRLRLRIPAIPDGQISPNRNETFKHKLYISFKPVGSFDVPSGQERGLARAIKNARAAIQIATETDHKFALESFTFEIQFVVKRDKSGRLTFVVFDEAGVSASDLFTQRLRIYMSRRETQ